MLLCIDAWVLCSRLAPHRTAPLHIAAAEMADSTKRPFAFTITSGGRTLLMAPDAGASNAESDRATWVATLLAARQALA